MRFIVEFRLKPGSKNKIVDAFELRGPNRIPGVTFREAWIGTKSEVVFVLAESENESLVVQAAESWGEQGEYKITPVINVEQF